MAIKYWKIDDGRVPPHEYLPAGAITPKWGMTLVMEGGELVLASGADMPEYLSMCEYSAAVPAGTLIPVTRIDDDMIYLAPLSAAGTALKIGDRVTIASDGLQVTATTGGMAEIVGIHGTAVGDEIEIRFTAE